MSDSTAPYQELLQRLQVSLGVQFTRQELLLEALTHPSFVGENELNRPPSNQRLEYLGDAVLGMIVSDHLFRRHPELSEGDLTKLKAGSVSEGALVPVAKQLGLGDFLLLGKGEDASGGRTRPSILADAFEALVGALYLEHGLEGAQRFVLSALAENLAAVEERRTVVDSKSRLQELIQASGQGTPTYHVIATSGPDHDKRFTVEVRTRQTALGRGVGASKKEAEQAAALNALGTAQSTETPKRRRRTRAAAATAAAAPEVNTP